LTGAEQSRPVREDDLEVGKEMLTLTEFLEMNHTAASGQQQRWQQISDDPRS
jgi:hypothetical protein